MKISINANSLKKLVRLLRNLADELEALYADNKPSTKTLRVVSQHDASIQEIVKYYQSVHPSRGRSVKPEHKDWKLIRKRLEDGYSVAELKTAILQNSRTDWWVKNNRHGIEDIMKKDGNLESFINSKNNAGGNNAKRGYTSGSNQFGKGYDGFGDGG